ncbi:MAG: bis(5'-nucleosyl)-tetraphosphatase (symmetrical) YqeK [Lachnospiraceae bacterium]|nr:bis(5'-nucleosyl)-tetraphosphatase (symmetrical) YqeK [Lachnospiraceae bacterium]
MDNEYIEGLRKKVKKALAADKNRYRHTLGVADTAACLAMRYAVDVQRAYTAGLLHDCAKCVPDSSKITECEAYGLEITPYERKSPYLLHAKLGAEYAKRLYGIEDPEICSAIAFHTTGKPNMTRLEEIIFLADYIEPRRNQASDLPEVRKEAFVDIQRAIFTVTADTLAYLKEKGKVIDPMTEQTYRYYADLFDPNGKEQKS